MYRNRYVGETNNESSFRKSLGRKQIANARLRDRKRDLRLIFFFKCKSTVK